MKKALSLMEVMISVVLISFVIGALIDIKKSNLSYLERFKKMEFDSSIITMVSNDTTNVSNRDKDILISDVVDFKDDDIRKELKNIKVSVEDEMIDDRIIRIDDYILSINVYESTYTLKDETASKKIYTIKLP